VLAANNRCSYKPKWHKNYGVFITLDIVALFPVVDPKIKQIEWKEIKRED
jgi:hypothetical protein